MTLAVIVLSILSVAGVMPESSLTQNPLIICIISAFTASYTSLYVRNKDKTDGGTADTGTASNLEKVTNWAKEDIDKYMNMNQAPVAQVKAEPVTQKMVVTN
ncbi:MAG: hypothetical protein LBP35_01685 [Candidatus Ancillula trichonymphae]|nr:hypothetical protein [Candidatus Ancillula trichonymphae]